MNIKLLAKIIIPFALGLIGLNIIYLDYAFFVKKNNQESSLPILEKMPKKFPIKTSEPVKETTSAAKIVDSCYPYSCVDLIRQATASSITQKTTTGSVASTGTREYYVSFGSGETKSDQYEDIPGLQANIDSSKYGTIKKVTFEASLRIPTANGKVYAQLFNATDKHPVWFSEVSSEGNTSNLKISLPITLDSGEKLYKAQMKTTLKYQSIVDQARVHILAE